MYQQQYQDAEFETAILKCFSKRGVGKRSIPFSKHEVFLRTEVKTVTATKEEKGEALLALIVHLHQKVQYP